jgi:AraC-like DNA-binding protein
MMQKTIRNMAAHHRHTTQQSHAQSGIAEWSVRNEANNVMAESWHSAECMAVEGLQERALQIHLADEHILQLQEWEFGGVRIRTIKGDSRDTLFRRQALDEDRVCLHFAVHETSQSEYGSRAMHRFHSHEHNLLHIPQSIAQTEFAPSGTLLQCSIEFTPEYFQALLPTDTGLLSPLRESIARQEFSVSQSKNVPMNSTMLAILHDIMSPQIRRGCLQKIYLESKVLELFVLHNEAVQSGNACSQCGLCASPRRSNTDALHEAHNILQQRFAEPPTLAELSRMIGINEFTLKQGFKRLFGTTVYGFVVERRMALARALLAQKTMSIREVAEHVGYQHTTHFTTAFKKHCGVLPSTYSKEL